MSKRIHTVKRIDTVSAGQESIEAALAQSVVESQALHAVFPDSGDATLMLGGITVIGTDEGDNLEGGEGDDTLDGAGGDDSLFGHNGNDTLLGGDGDDNDWLDGGAGADILNGGVGGDGLNTGFDTASYRDAAAPISIDLTKDSSTWTNDARGDVLISIEAFSLTDFDDTFRGDANANIVFGHAGNDQIFGAGGNDALIGDEGNDIIQGGDGHDFVHGDNFVRGNSDPAGVPGDDYLQGNAGDDMLFGDGGNDIIVGGTGNDTLVGGLGGDRLVGNEGADIFQYTAVEESQNVLINGVNQLDQIVDFTQGQDTIDLYQIDANSALLGNQTFTFISDPAHYTGDWTGVVWQTINPQSGIAIINVSIDGDAAPEMQIYMSHPYQFTASDFIL
jgi:Ca2+-binding RTX toxin-like protein